MATIRKLSFVNEYVYHIYNRGVERRRIYTSDWEYKRFLMLLDYYRFKGKLLSFSEYLKLPNEIRQLQYHQTALRNQPAIEIIAFCLLPNHFHLIIKQKADFGIVRSLSNISNSYAKYFNIKHKRVGPLFQGPFKAVLVETDEQLLHLSRYVHINPVISSLVKLPELGKYFWSSLPTYLGHASLPFISSQTVLSHFRSTEQYRKFLYDHIAYAKELNKVKHLTYEE